MLLFNVTKKYIIDDHEEILPLLKALGPCRDMLAFTTQVHDLLNIHRPDIASGDVAISLATLLADTGSVFVFPNGDIFDAVVAEGGRTTSIMHLVDFTRRALARETHARCDEPTAMRAIVQSIDRGMMKLAA
ncbi:hypothetical protein ACOI1H_14715 [Loktanella sp. DJP18]|uniref:hypothetical protein n=1 Tax=Loktanella sp. DJP18 TaxID=3409788 RepID=UPI003BB594F4